MSAPGAIRLASLYWAGAEEPQEPYGWVAVLSAVTIDGEEVIFMGYCLS